MRNFFLSLTLSLILAISVNAGETPIAGVVGCAPGLWYPESHACVYGLSAPVQPPNKDAAPTNIESMLIKAFLYIKNIVL